MAGEMATWVHRAPQQMSVPHLQRRSVRVHTQLHQCERVEVSRRSAVGVTRGSSLHACTYLCHPGVYSRSLLRGAHPYAAAEEGVDAAHVGRDAGLFHPRQQGGRGGHVPHERVALEQRREHHHIGHEAGADLHSSEEVSV